MAGAPRAGWSRCRRREQRLGGGLLAAAPEQHDGIAQGLHQHPVVLALEGLGGQLHLLAHQGGGAQFQHLGNTAQLMEGAGALVQDGGVAAVLGERLEACLGFAERGVDGLLQEGQGGGIGDGDHALRNPW